jgi:hypothetical protein
MLSSATNITWLEIFFSFCFPLLLSGPDHDNSELLSAFGCRALPITAIKESNNFCAAGLIPIPVSLTVKRTVIEVSVTEGGDQFEKRLNVWGSN